MKSDTWYNMDEHEHTVLRRAGHKGWKDTHRTTPFTGNVQKKDICRDSRLMVAKGWGWRNWGECQWVWDFFLGWQCYGVRQQWVTYIETTEFYASTVKFILCYHVFKIRLYYPSVSSLLLEQHKLISHLRDFTEAPLPPLVTQVFTNHQG